MHGEAEGGNSSSVCARQNMHLPPNWYTASARADPWGSWRVLFKRTTSFQGHRCWPLCYKGVASIKQVWFGVINEKNYPIWNSGSAPAVRKLCHYFMLSWEAILIQCISCHCGELVSTEEAKSFITNRQSSEECLLGMEVKDFKIVSRKTTR